MPDTSLDHQAASCDLIVERLPSVAGRTLPMFHNALVDGSSPTSSPRQTPAPTLAPLFWKCPKNGALTFRVPALIPSARLRHWRLPPASQSHRQTARTMMIFQRIAED